MYIFKFDVKYISWVKVGFLRHFMWAGPSVRSHSLKTLVKRLKHLSSFIASWHYFKSLRSPLINNTPTPLPPTPPNSRVRSYLKIHERVHTGFTVKCDYCDFESTTQGKSCEVEGSPFGSTL